GQGAQVVVGALDLGIAHAVADEEEDVLGGLGGSFGGGGGGGLCRGGSRGGLAGGGGGGAAAGSQAGGHGRSAQQCQGAFAQVLHHCNTLLALFSYSAGTTRQHSGPWPLAMVIIRGPPAGPKPYTRQITVKNPPRKFPVCKKAASPGGGAFCCRKTKNPLDRKILFRGQEKTV